MMQKGFQRRYILLRPAGGQASGFARMECQRGRGRLSIHASGLPEKPLRALLLCGDAQTGAVLDLGLMHPTGGQQAALCRDHIGLQGGYQALVLATDWPDAQLLLYGWLHSRPGCTLWQMQEAVQRYLAYPAMDSAPAPVEYEEKQPERSVLMLRRRVST